jgi:DNA-directed RNA polymerase specialized sigma24 family protein
MIPTDEARFIELWQQGASYRDIAQALDCPLGTVASRVAALVAQGKVTPRPRGGRRAKALQGMVHDTVQSSAGHAHDTGAQTVHSGAVHAPLHGAVQVQNSAEPPIPAALAAELGRLWAAIDALRQDVHRPVHDTVQSLPEPMFDDPADNATERWNLYLKHGLRVRIESVAQARGVAPSRVVQEILFQALTDRRSSRP